jgi:hypothetical protein
MKFVEIKNVSKDCITVSQIRGFRLAPGESMKVHPATAAHPAVRRYLPPQGSSLELVTPGVSTAEVEPIAPAIPQESAQEAPVAVVEEAVVETVTVEPATVAAEVIEDAAAPAEEMPAAEEAQEEPAPEMAGKTLRETFIEGPGVTESNVDALCEAFASVEALSEASKDALLDLGLSSSASKKLISWAKNQLD